MLRSISMFLAAGVVALGGPIVSNLPGNDLFGDFVGNLPEDVGFTMGAKSYTLNSADLRLQVTGTVPPVSFTVNLYNDSGSLTPGTLAVSLGGMQLNSGGAPTTFNFVPASSFILGAGQTYWIGITAPPGNLLWLASTPGVADSNSVASMSNFKFTADGGKSWQASTSLLSYDVNATLVPAPEPSTFAMLGAGLLFFVRKRLK